MTIDVSPFDPNMVFVWAETAENATDVARPYFGHDMMSAHHTGLTEPGDYGYDYLDESEVVGRTMRRYAVKGSLR